MWADPRGMASTSASRLEPFNRWWSGRRKARASSSLRDLQLLHCRGAGVVSDTLARVLASSLVVRSSEGAAIVALDHSRVVVEALTSERNEQGPVWAECQSGASVELWRVNADQAFELVSPCVEPH